MKRTLLFVMMFGLACPCLARTSSIADNPMEGAADYYDRHAEGWYWYHDPELEREPEEEPETPKPAPAPATPTPPAALSAAWVREMLPKYKDLAWDNPTPENVEAYFLLQRFAMDRSQRFAQVAERVVTGNPYLDETNRRPSASYAIPYVDRQAGNAEEELLAKMTTKVGLFFFFKSNCPYCEAQAPLIKTLEEQGFDVLAVSVDGGALQSTEFAHTRINSGQAEQLGVTATPALFLVSDQGEFSALGQGLMSLPDIKRRILLAAARSGWITEEDFNTTRPIMQPNDQEHNLSVQLPRMLQAQNTQQTQPNDPRPAKQVVRADGFIEPKDLLSLLNPNRLSGDLTDEQK